MKFILKLYVALPTPPLCFMSTKTGFSVLFKKSQICFVTENVLFPCSKRMKNKRPSPNYQWATPQRVPSQGAGAVPPQAAYPREVHGRHRRRRRRRRECN